MFAIVVSVTWGVSQFHFQLFNCIWSILVLLYVGIAPFVLPSIVIPLAALGVLVLTSLFWFAGSIAMAVWVGNFCGNWCPTAQAGAAFGFFIWAGFTALAVMEGLAWRRGGGSTKSTPSNPGV